MIVIKPEGYLVSNDLFYIHENIGQIATKARTAH